MTRSFVALVVAGFTLVAASAVRADEAQARALFREGTEALHAGRFPQARDLLRRSLELHPHQATAFNLIVALRGTEQPSEAVGVCRRLLEGAYGELPAERHAQADVMCEDVAAQIATLEIVASGAPGTIEVRVDGRLEGLAEDGRTLEARVDPGAHVVEASHTGFNAAESRVSVGGGDVRRVELPLTPVEEGTSTYWWIAAGGAAAILVGAVVLVVVSSGDDPQLEMGTLLSIGTP